MKKREVSESGGLGQSDDEAILSALMRKSLDGDSESYRLLLKKVSELMLPFVTNSLSRFGLSATGGQEDVIQEILLAVHQKRATFDPEQFFLPWMYAIARYKAIDHLRRNKIFFRSASIDESVEQLGFGQSLEWGAELDIKVLCGELPDKQRDVLLLVKVEGLTIDEAAAKTGFSPSDIKVTVHRALKSLKKIVKDAGHEN